MSTINMPIANEIPNSTGNHTYIFANVSNVSIENVTVTVFC